MRLNRLIVGTKNVSIRIDGSRNISYKPYNNFWYFNVLTMKWTYHDHSMYSSVKRLVAQRFIFLLQITTTSQISKIWMLNLSKTNTSPGLDIISTFFLNQEYFSITIICDFAWKIPLQIFAKIELLFQSTKFYCIWLSVEWLCVECIQFRTKHRKRDIYFRLAEIYPFSF